MKFWMKAAAALAFSGLATLTAAQTLAEAKAMLEAAQLSATQKGLRGAATDFNAGGKWKKPRAYVVLVDFNGNLLARSDNTRMVGENVLEAKDAKGKAFVKETIKAVQAADEALVDMGWTDPDTKKVDSAKMLARRVPGQAAYVAVAFFD